MIKYALLLAGLLALPAFADDSLCTANLQLLSEQAKDGNQDVSQGKNSALQQAIDKARQAQAAGNEKECIALTTQALETSAKPSKDD
ncbi:hypothetical protein [Pseudomonas nitroreducens]|uniref:hypothetical protein n=1 Tax=Pseudomonas nitroreducens TaxID=46680 RepID=UPI0020A05A05|nr:hypothetical protein [Pseudomonas nitroreducens]MCP1626863.1 hypothetical protein [Pseudomonas nitroreducens]